MDLSLQNSGPFICEGGSSEPTKPPGYGPVIVGITSTTFQHKLKNSSITAYSACTENNLEAKLRLALMETITRYQEIHTRWRNFFRNSVSVKAISHNTNGCSTSLLTPKCNNPTIRR